MWLASVVADPCETDEAVERQRSMVLRQPRAGNGGLSGVGDSHLNVGGGTSEVSAMVGTMVSQVWTLGNINAKVSCIRTVLVLNRGRTW